MGAAFHQMGAGTIMIQPTCIFALKDKETLAVTSLAVFLPFTFFFAEGLRRRGGRGRQWHFDGNGGEDNSRVATTATRETMTALLLLLCFFAGASS